MKRFIVILFSIVGTIMLIFSLFYMIDKDSMNFTGILISFLFFIIAFLVEKTNSLVVKTISYIVIMSALLGFMFIVYVLRHEINEIITYHFLDSVSDEHLLNDYRIHPEDRKLILTILSHESDKHSRFYGKMTDDELYEIIQALNYQYLESLSVDDLLIQYRTHSENKTLILKILDHDTYKLNQFLDKLSTDELLEIATSK